MAVLLSFIDVPLARVRRTTLGGLPNSGADIQGAFSLELSAHQTVAVVGDEGSGVDTLAGLAMGLEPVPAGRVVTLGTEITLLDRVSQLAFRRKLGYLPAGDGLMQNLTLRENIRLPLRFGSDFRPKDIEGRVDVIVAQLRMTRVAEQRPAESNAEDRRRAALARALAFDPELVVLEEPFDGLTDRAAGELLEAARGGETSEGGRRTVFITAASLPALLRNRVDRQYRLVRGTTRGGSLAMRTRTADALVGLLVVGAVLIVLVGIVVTRGWTERRITIYMLSPSVQDLKQDTPVYLQGLAIGEVSSISPQADTGLMLAPQFLVALRLRERYANGVAIRLPQGTKGQISSSGLIGAASIALDIPKVHTGGAIAPGDTIRGELTEGWTDVLKEVADSLRTQVSDILHETRTLLATLDKTASSAQREVAATAPQLRETLASARQVLVRLDPMIEQTKNTVASTDQRMGVLQDSLTLLLSDTRKTDRARRHLDDLDVGNRRHHGPGPSADPQERVHPERQARVFHRSGEPAAAPAAYRCPPAPQRFSGEARAVKYLLFHPPSWSPAAVAAALASEQVELRVVDGPGEIKADERPTAYLLDPPGRKQVTPELLAALKDSGCGDTCPGGARRGRRSRRASRRSAGGIRSTSGRSSADAGSTPRRVPGLDGRIGSRRAPARRVPPA